MHSGAIAVDTAIERIGTGRFQAWTLAATGLTWAGDAMELAVLAYVLPALKREWGLTQAVADGFASAIFCGMLVGSLGWGLFSDRYGRRLGWLATTALTAAGGALSAAAPDGSVGLFLAARALCGVGLAGTNLGFAVSSEILPRSSRGTWMILFEVFFVGGSVFVVLLAWACLRSLGWRSVLLLSTLPLWLALCLQRCVPESPRWLVGHGLQQRAADALAAAARANGRPPPLSSSECLVVASAGLSAGCSDGVGPSPRSRRFGWVALLGAPFDRSIRTSSLSLCACWFLLAFVYFGMVMLTPKLLAVAGTDDASSVEPSPVADAAADADADASSYSAALGSTLAELPGLLVATALINRAGRVRTAVGCILSSAIVLAVLALAPASSASGVAVDAHYVPLLTALCRMGAFGGFSTLYVITTELYPTRLRATAFGLVSACSRIAGTLTPWVAGSLWEASRTAALLAYAAAAALCAAVLACVVREVGPMVEELDERASLVREAAGAAELQPPLPAACADEAEAEAEGAEAEARA